MAAILGIALPFFAIIFAGYVVMHWRLMDRGVVAGLNAFVFYVSLPALLVGQLAQAPVERLLDWRFVLVFYGASVLVYGGFLAVSLLRGDTLGVAAMRGLTAIFGNWGYMGIPLLLQAFGSEGAVLAVLAVLLDNIVSVPVTVGLIEASRGGAGLAGVGRTLRSVGRNPLVLATLAGVSLALSGLALPLPVAGFLDLLGSAAAPCALFALGGTLVDAPKGEARGEVAVVSLARLVAHPALVAAGAFWLVAMPTHLAQAAVLVAALPTGATCFVVGQRYGVYALRASTMVLATHVFGVFTLTVLIAWFSG